MVEIENTQTNPLIRVGGSLGCSFSHLVDMQARGGFNRLIALQQLFFALTMGNAGIANLANVTF